MTKAELRRLHDIERELAALARREGNDEQAKLLWHAANAVGGAAFGPPIGAKYNVPQPPDLPFSS